MALIIKLKGKISSSYITCCQSSVLASSNPLKFIITHEASRYQTSRPLSLAAYVLGSANVSSRESFRDPRVSILYESTIDCLLVSELLMTKRVNKMLKNIAGATQFCIPTLTQQNAALTTLTNTNTISKFTSSRISPKISQLGIETRDSKLRVLNICLLNRMFFGFSRFLPSSIIENYMLYTSGKSISSAFSSLFVRHMTSSARKTNFIEDKRTSENEQAKLSANKRCNKQVKINACGKLYDELVKTRSILYGGAPSGSGIDFDVQYYDSLDLINCSKDKQSDFEIPTTVCLLHGSPGHYKYYASLINYLTIRGIRVIAPNFPDYSATFDHSFRHSPQERVQFLLEFFKNIHVSKIDLLIGHSGAVYTMLELLDHVLGIHKYKQELLQPLEIRSIGLFNTPMYNLPPNLAVTPFRLFTLKLFDYSFFRPLITALIRIFVKVQGIKNRVDKDKMEDFLIAASVVGYSDLGNLEKQMKAVVKVKLPAFILIGTNDRLISMDYFDQLKRDFGITNRHQVKLYDSDGKVLSEPIEPHESVDVSQFEGGGHFTFQMYANQVNEDVYRFLIKRVNHQLLESTKL